MSTAQPTSNTGATLFLFLIAALFLGGAAAGFVLAGLGGVILWFVLMSFVMLGLLVVLSIA
ncbi:hypothetical protein FBT96_12100 [Rhodobacter capsulatus]|uniref:Uncharacterized protein n=1 Tax=Rhodobacter capsulatus TaxID=1061 RepID=A0A4U1JR66_RHOCA|nr:hypothetical protein [Rhodobacter capsulatus]TKD17886.1 hypothetical protein FBT96_12100 [Rhodobacter capsulatus]